DVGQTEDGRFYLVSKYVPGKDLQARLQDGRLSHREVAEIIAHAAEALHYAHQHGLVHRDIKPANILLDAAGRPIVADFGLALRHWQTVEPEKAAVNVQVMLPPTAPPVPAPLPQDEPQQVQVDTNGQRLSETITPDSDKRPTRVVPKGLRSFDSEDADFFLELLPGPRDRDGLPESVRFWKTRIESADPHRTFSVGLLYGPSGCGKSSLVKAGLCQRR